ncbi:hypothetical protein C0992_009007 [Termitomyces sp. T32_za158]|nr:hypothetical protein C0992_009007 [Termitomyces sp. T32_za158]
MGEKTEVRMGEPQQAGPGGSPSALVVLVGPRADKGKRKAAPSSGPVKRVCRRVSPVRPIAEAGLSGLHVFSPVSGFPVPALGAMQARLEEAGFDSGIGASAVLYIDSEEVSSLRYHLSSAAEHTVYKGELVGFTLGLHLLKSINRQL